MMNLLDSFEQARMEIQATSGIRFESMDKRSWIILYNNQRIGIGRSSSNSWCTKEMATNALRLHVRDRLLQGPWGNSQVNNWMDSYYPEWITKHIKIMRLGDFGKQKEIAAKKKAKAARAKLLKSKAARWIDISEEIDD